MSAFASARSAFRSTGFRRAASKHSDASKPSRSNTTFSLPKQTPTHRICRFPLETSSVCLESMMPYHTATASAMLNSMLSANQSVYGWNLDDCNDDV